MVQRRITNFAAAGAIALAAISSVQTIPMAEAAAPGPATLRRGGRRMRRSLKGEAAPKSNKTGKTTKGGVSEDGGFDEVDVAARAGGVGGKAAKTGKTNKKGASTGEPPIHPSNELEDYSYDEYLEYDEAENSDFVAPRAGGIGAPGGEKAAKTGKTNKKAPPPGHNGPLLPRPPPPAHTAHLRTEYKELTPPHYEQLVHGHHHGPPKQGKTSKAPKTGGR